MSKDREPKLRRRPPPAERPQLLQVMPGGRVRLDPTIREAVAVWLIAFLAPFTKEACASERGLKGAERDTFQRRREYYRHAVKAVGEAVASLCDTLPIESIDSALAEVRDALSLVTVAPPAEYPPDSDTDTTDTTAAE